MHLTRLPYGGKRLCREEGNTKDETERMALWKKEAFAFDLTRCFFRRMPAMEGEIEHQMRESAGSMLPSHACRFFFVPCNLRSKQARLRFRLHSTLLARAAVHCQRDTKARRAQNVFAPIDG